MRAPEILQYKGRSLDRFLMLQEILLILIILLILFEILQCLMYCVTYEEKKIVHPTQV